MPKRGVACAAAIMALFVFCVPTLAELPGEKSGDSYTDAQRIPGELQYTRKEFVDTYTTVGKRNPAWDVQAVAFFEQLGRYLDYVSLFPPFKPDDVRGAPELARAAEQLLAKGCDDPLVGYGYAVALTGLHRDAEAVAQLRKVIVAVKQGTFPPAAKASAAHRLLKFKNFLLPDEPAALKQMLEENCIEMARGIQPTRQGRELMLVFSHAMLDDDHAMEERVCRAIANMKDADPWLVEALTGVHEVGEAWDARGADLAFKVMPQGWKGFESHLADARRHLTRAWQMEPMLSGPAANMITVVMGDGGLGNETMRTWFDRALQARFDDRDAWGRMTWGLRPRWGGSLAQMLALGRECAATRRYDTTVPMWLLLTIAEMTDEAQDKTGSLWAEPATYRDVQQVLEDYQQVMPAGRRRDWFVSWQAAVAWRAGKFEEARKSLEKLTTPVALDCFRTVTERPALMASQVYAFTGAFADRARQATADFEAAQVEQAAKAFLEMSDATSDADKAAFYFDEYSNDLQTRLQLDAGQWINLIPKRGLHGWTPITGDWTVDAQGRLVGVWNEGGLLLTCKADLGRRYEVTATFEYDHPKGLPAAIGFALDHNGETFGNGLFISKGYNGVSTYVNFHSAVKAATVQQVNTVHILTWDKTFSATLNDQPVNVPEPQGQLLDAGGNQRLAIYSLYPATDTKLYVTELKARKLKLKP